MIAHDGAGTGDGSAVHAKAAAVSLDIELIGLHANTDARGGLTEIFREDWVRARAVQWNLVRSEANVLRGVHVHVLHEDYVVPIAGRIVVGLSDVREGTPAFGAAQILELSSERPQLLVIPPGIAHGFYLPEAATFTYGVSEYWNPAHDELGCRWDDPELGIAWPANAPMLSGRDEHATSRALLLERLRGIRPEW